MYGDLSKEQKSQTEKFPLATARIIYKRKKIEVNYNP
jgi:hypothetical protein